MDKLSSVGVFVRAAETRNFSEAGRQLGSSSSAVGKAISRLEERLGVRLFHRSTRSVTLTSEGQMFLARCLRVLDELEAAEVELSAGQSPRGLLRISLPIASTLLAPVLGSFMREYPDIRLDLDFTDRIVDVIEGGFDIVLRTGDAGDSRLVSRVLGYYSPKLVASPRYLRSRGSPVAAADLARHDCLVHRFPSTGKVDPWLMVEAGTPVEVALNVLVTASAVEPLVDMVTQGLGIAYLPDFLVDAQVESGELVEVLPGRVIDRKVFRALWPSGRNLSPKVRVLVDYLAESLLPSGAEVGRTSST
jgi:DNA-binding transcriptional LysR family regulator